MIKKIIFICIFTVIFVILWQYAENIINQNRLNDGRTALEAFIPSPLTIGKVFLTDGKIILGETFETLKKASVGFLLGTGFAIFIACTFVYFPILRNIVFPFAFTVNSFPIVGFAPAVILAFGQGSWFSIVFISALICYFPILISLDTAFKHIDKNILNLMKIFNANNKQTLIKIYFPLSLPYLFLSLKLAIPASIIGATMGEWLGSRTGIGQLITISMYQLKPGLLYASLISITVSSLILILIINLLEKIYIPWSENYREK